MKADRHAAAFKRRHGKKVFEEKGRVYAKLKREFRTADKLAKKIIKDDYLKDKVKKISL